MSNSIDISKFYRNSEFYGKLNLLLTVKNFDLQSIRKRYLDSVKNVSGRTGSIKRRKVGDGGLVELTIENGKIKNNTILGKFKEPRGIALAGDVFAFSSENRVYVLNNGIIDILDYEWFSYIHTLDFSPFDFSRLLVSSSGFDALFEFDLVTKKKCFEWFAWENGFSKGVDPETGKDIYLTRDPIVAKEYLKDNIPFIQIKDPLNEVLPTAKRAAFINSVVYDNSNEGFLLATFFHEGAVYSIDQSSGNVKKLIGDLIKPHGAKNYGDLKIVTSTGTGEVAVFSSGQEKRYSFSNLEGKPDFLKDMEWVQNTVKNGKTMIGLDSNRTSFVIFDPEKQLYDTIPYDANWAIQDAVLGNLDSEQKKMIEGVSKKD